jgi:hypothetical protein
VVGRRGAAGGAGDSAGSRVLEQAAVRCAWCSAVLHAGDTVLCW